MLDLTTSRSMAYEPSLGSGGSRSRNPTAADWKPACTTHKFRYVLDCSPDNFSMMEEGSCKNC